MCACMLCIYHSVNTHALARRHRLTFTHTYTSCVYMHASSIVYTHARVHKDTHTRARARARTHARTHTHRHTYTHTHTPHIRAHARPHCRTQTNTRARGHAHSDSTRTQIIQTFQNSRINFYSVVSIESYENQ